MHLARSKHSCYLDVDLEEQLGPTSLHYNENILKAGTVICRFCQPLAFRPFRLVEIFLCSFPSLRYEKREAIPWQCSSLCWFSKRDLKLSQSFCVQNSFGSFREPTYETIEDAKNLGSRGQLDLGGLWLCLLNSRLALCRLSFPLRLLLVAPVNGQVCLHWICMVCTQSAIASDSALPKQSWSKRAKKVSAAISRDCGLWGKTLLADSMTMDTSHKWCEGVAGSSMGVLGNLPRMCWLGFAMTYSFVKGGKAVSMD